LSELNKVNVADPTSEHQLAGATTSTTGNDR